MLLDGVHEYLFALLWLLVFECSLLAFEGADSKSPQFIERPSLGGLNIGVLEVLKRLGSARGEATEGGSCCVEGRPVGMTR